MKTNESTRITIELTNYCPNRCKYCSSDTTTDYDKATFVKYEDVIGFLASHDRYETIILSGGEPLAHPLFYNILRLCKQRTDHVVVYTNELSHIVYNANVIDGVRIDANLTVLDSTATVKILKRVEQGREARRPDVTFSRNFTGDCRGCGESVLLPNGTIAPSPCKKDEPSPAMVAYRKYLTENPPRPAKPAPPPISLDPLIGKYPDSGDLPCKKERRRYVYKVKCIDCDALFDTLDELEAHWVDAHEKITYIKKMDG